MSLSDGKAPSRRAKFSRIVIGAALTAAVLGGCQVRPLYGTLDENGSYAPVAAELSAVEVDPIGSSDAARYLLNELIFKFERGAGAPDKRYNLKILADVSSAGVAVEQFADVPSAFNITMNSTFVLSSKDSGDTLMTGRSFSTASYDFSDQRFANKRALRDAEERVAKAVADDITARVAGYFASRS